VVYTGLKGPVREKAEGLIVVLNLFACFSQLIRLTPPRIFGKPPLHAMTKRPEMRCRNDAFGPADAVLLGKENSGGGLVRPAGNQRRPTLKGN